MFELNLDSFIYWINVITVLFSGLAMLFSGKNWWRNRKLSQYIPLYINRCGEKEFLEIEIVRRDISRSELFGILGDLEKDRNFKIAYFSTKEFFKQLEEVQKSKKDEFVIYLKECDKFERK